jgi:hypothetical protein
MPFPPHLHLLIVQISCPVVVIVPVQKIVTVTEPVVKQRHTNALLDASRLVKANLRQSRIRTCEVREDLDGESVHWRPGAKAPCHVSQMQTDTVFVKQRMEKVIID